MLWTSMMQLWEEIFVIGFISLYMIENLIHNKRFFPKRPGSPYMEKCILITIDTEVKNPRPIH
jgi:hypothetical protein